MPDTPRPGHDDAMQPADADARLAPTADDMPDDRPAPISGLSEKEQVELRRFVVRAAGELRDGKCTDILILDVRGLSPVTHYVMIANGTSDTQLRAVARDITAFAKQNGHQRYGNERDEASTWLALDFIDLMVHLFEPATRSTYDLEMMWGDAPRVPWRDELSALNDADA